MGDDAPTHCGMPDLYVHCCAWMLIYKYAMFLFGTALLCFFVELSAMGGLDAVEEWAVFKGLEDVNSAFCIRFLAPQMVLYIPEDVMLLNPLIDHQWEALKGQEDRERLVYYYVLGGVGRSVSCDTAEFHRRSGGYAV